MSMITKKDLKGAIASFPLDVVEKMLERQEEQSGKADIRVFQANPVCGFAWECSPEGQDFWDAVINNHDWVTFWKRYPSQPKPKQKYEVSVTEKRCPRCGETKTASEFGINRSQRDGLQTICKKCKSKENHKRYENMKGPKKIEKAVKKLQSIPVEKPDMALLAKFTVEELSDELQSRGCGKPITEFSDQEIVNELNRRKHIMDEGRFIFSSEVILRECFKNCEMSAIIAKIEDRDLVKEIFNRSLALTILFRSDKDDLLKALKANSHVSDLLKLIEEKDLMRELKRRGFYGSIYNKRITRIDL